MLFNTIKRRIGKLKDDGDAEGLADLRQKIGVLYLGGSLTQSEYEELIALLDA